MYKKILQKADLSPTQAEILEYLYQKKEAKASEIAKKIKKSRAIVYKDLDELVDLSIVERIDKANQVSLFIANHPSTLEKLMDKKENEIKKDQELLKNYLPDLISSYNLINNKPGIKFYEGDEGIKKVIYDTFNSDEIIYTYADIETINKYIKKINADYAKKRDEKGLEKKIIFSDTPYSKKFLKTYHLKTTDSRIIPGLKNFYTVMQIYSNKISYITLSKEAKIGVIIENKEIYQMQRALFEHAWNSAEGVHEED